MTDFAPLRRLIGIAADALIDLAAVVAPGSERRPWLREWEGEIAHLRGRAAGRDPGLRADLEVLRRSGGALVHALWLRGQEWRPDMLAQDLRFALRSLARRPGFTAIIIGTIALGIGVNAGIFSVLYDVVLEPLPYEEPDELVMVWERDLDRDQPTNVVAPANFFLWREDTDLFESLVAATWFSQTLSDSEEPERVGAVAVNAGFFEMLGVTPGLGRFFLAEEDEFGASARPVVLSHEFWQRRFGGDPGILGRVIGLSGVDRTVIGVLPAGFGFDHLPFSFNAPPTQDVWIPQGFDPALRTWRGRWLQVVGRLRDGVTLERARIELEALATRLEAEFPERQRGWTVNVVPLQAQIVGDARTAIIILFGAVSLVLLIACANVANLLLSRSTDRSREIAVRTALGANRLRLIRQLLTEAGLLAAAGGAFGLVLAFGMVRALVALGPDVPRISEVGLDGTVVAFTVLVSAGTGVLFGLMPALRASRPDLVGSLKDGGVRAGGGVTTLRVRSALVVSQIALALILLVGSGLLVRSFATLLDQGVGFATGGLMTAEIGLSGGDYADEEARVAFFEGLVERLSGAPGVAAAGAITNLPLSGSQTGTSYWINDREMPAEGEGPVADIRWVHRDYHATMGIPVRRGRSFLASDTRDAPLRVLINETMARTHWPGEDPVGRTISMVWNDTMVAEIVGVVGDVRHNGPEMEPRDKIYWHHLQWQDRTNMTVVVRSEGDPIVHAGTIRAAVREMDPSVPLYNVRTMDGWMSEVMASRRFTMLALGLFSLVALVLASVGVYGVMSYNVSQRTREFGVRLALGASKRAVAMDVVGSGMRLVLLAVAIGSVGALALASLLRSLVYGVSTTDPVSFIAAGAFLVVVAALACYRPAHRAGKVDPIRALRFE